MTGRDPVARGFKGLPAWVLVEADVRRRPDGVVTVSYFDPVGELHNVRLVAPTGRMWWARAGRELLPLGLEQIADEADRLNRTLLVAEGESDALQLRACFWAVEDDGRSRFDVLGLPGASTWREPWTRWFQGYGRVVVIPDGDAAGRKLGAAIKRDYPAAQVVELPAGEDARSLLQAHGPDALDPYLEQAEQEALLARAFTECATLAEAEALLRGSGFAA